LRKKAISKVCRVCEAKRIAMTMNPNEIVLANMKPAARIG
jgi:hypothetical protein